MQAVAFLHDRLAVALILFAVLLGLWGSFQFLRSRSLTPGFRSAYLMMLALTAVQGAAGVLAFSAYRPRELLHVLYGLFALLFLPGVYLYAGRGPRAREAAFLAAACWIVAVAYGRGILTGR